MQKSLEKQMKRDFDKFIVRDGVDVVLSYHTPPLNTTNNLWNTGVPQTSTIRVLYHVVSDLDFRDNSIANVQAGKTVFYIPGSMSFGNIKNIRIELNGRIFEIDKVIGDKKLSNNNFLYWMFIQK